MPFASTLPHARRRAAFLVLFSGIAAFAPAMPSADERPAPAELTPATAPAPAREVPAARPAPLRPLLIEVHALLAVERATLGALSARARAASTDRELLATQREIERVRTETEVAILRVQRDHARAAGRTDVAARLDEALRALQSPPSPPPAAARPAPSSTPSAATPR